MASTPTITQGPYNGFRIECTPSRTECKMGIHLILHHDIMCGQSEKLSWHSVIVRSTLVFVRGRERAVNGPRRWPRPGHLRRARGVRPHTAKARVSA